MNASPANEDTFLKHIGALRAGLIRCLVGVTLAFCVTAYFSKDLYLFLSLPMKRLLPPGSHFITTHPVEAWYAYMKTAAFSAVFLSSPLIFRELWTFVSPGLYASERRLFAAFVAASSAFFIGGALFGYFVVFPSGFGYFVSILQGTDIMFLPRMDDYLGFAFQMLLAFGIVFETPFLMFFLTASGAVSFDALWKFQRYYVLVAAVIAAVLTPPDVVSQIMMGAPMVLLYEVGLIGSWLYDRRRKTIAV